MMASIFTFLKLNNVYIPHRHGVDLHPLSVVYATLAPRLPRQQDQRSQLAERGSHVGHRLAPLPRNVRAAHDRVGILRARKLGNQVIE